LNSELVRARKTLRAELRTRRRQIPQDVRARAADRIASFIEQRFHLHPGQRIALYSPLPDELDIAPLERLARLHGCLTYLPRITDRREHRMDFVEARGPLEANRMGILEPRSRRSISPRALDLVFLPLVGFDAAGMRLGMGGGYYDRAFAFLRLRDAWHRPKLIGVGFAIQRVGALHRAPHDLHLDAVVTEEGVLTCRSGC
jgi:5-formyltetrahydrofolate cyclo-ligase